MYIAKALKQGFICPSSSPASASFFFVSRKYSGLCRIDYRGLNAITKKYKYPLPIVPSTLDLWNVYKLVLIQE